MLTEKAINYE